MKVWNYVFLALTMMLFLHFAGYATAIDDLFRFASITFNPDQSLNSTDITSSDFYDYLFDDVFLGDYACG